MKRTIAYTLALIMVFTTIGVAYSLDCSVTTSCAENEILRLSSLDNAHAELPSPTPVFTNIVCCDQPSGSEPVLKLSDITNAHVEDPSLTNYANEAGLDNADCDVITSGTCADAGHDTCVVSFSEPTNAHAGDCSAYSNKVCCSTVSECGNGALDFPEQCDDGNNNNGDGCSSTCTSEEGDFEFDEIQIIDNGDGTYTYLFIKDGVPVVEVISNHGLIDLRDFQFDYQEVGGSGKVAVSIGNLTLNQTTKSITIPMRQKICSVDDPSFLSGSMLGQWECWDETGRITWSVENGNSCLGAATPVEAKDQNENNLPDYTCQEVTINGDDYAKISGYVYTTVIGEYEENDEDGDGVVDEVDKCAGTVLPETPLEELRPNHLADLDGDLIFETNTGSAAAHLIEDSAYSLVDSYGCSCEQILYCKPGNNNGEQKWGCTAGTMDTWVNQLDWSLDCQVDGIVALEGESKDLLENTDGSDLVDLIDGDNDNDGIPDSEDSEDDSAAPEPGKQGKGTPDWWCDKHPTKC